MVPAKWKSGRRVEGGEEEGVKKSGKKGQGSVKKTAGKQRGELQPVIWLSHTSPLLLMKEERDKRDGGDGRGKGTVTDEDEKI